MALVSTARPVLETIMESRHGSSTSTAITLTMESINSSSGGGIEEEEARREQVRVDEEEEEDEKVYVAVGKDVKESSSTLLWALQHLEGKKKKICILHVHQPAHMIPTMMGVEIAANKLEEAEVRAYRDIEKTKKHSIINAYLRICAHVGVQAQKLDIDSNNVEKGIVSLIAKHGINKLIMGAAADKCYTKRMTTIKSKKAVFVNEHAHACCEIWFVCNRCLIHKREIGLEGKETEVGESPLSASNGRTAQRGNLKSRSFSAGLSEHAKVSGLQSFIRRISFRRGRVTTVSSLDRFKDKSVLQEQLPSEVSADGWDKISRKSSSESSAYSTCLSSEEVIGSLEPMPHAIYATCHSSPLLEEGGIEGEMYNQLQQTRSEAKDSVREAFQESRCPRAEKDALKAKWKAKTSENLCPNEVRRRHKMEKTALDQSSALENQIADSNGIIRELEEKMFSAVELLESIREVRDQLLLERDNAVREVEELRIRIEKDVTSLQRPRFTPEFSFKEIEEATHSFDPSLVIGKGGYGHVYRGFLRSTEVAIKRLHSNSSQGHAEFQQEVVVLGRMRHPNLVALIGACPEAGSLIYEYLPNGSLEDRLNCKNNTPPLPWQRRICIAVEVCCALIFLHSSKPDSVIHGDMKPANILLDANFVSKLGDFGICRLVSRKSIDGTTPCCVTNPKGTPGYMDPAFLLTGELTAKSDVYSYGIILLRLLTGRPVLNLVKEVQYAMEKGKLSTLLDATAGAWPFVRAKQLAKLALRCCDTNREIRPDLKSEVWRMLGPMKASCGGFSSHH